MATQTKLQEALTTEATNTKIVGKKWRGLIIEANRWGSSAYYPAEVLERDGPRVFHSGLQMYRDHPKADDEWNQPERSIDRLVGTLSSDAEFGDEGDGLGLYADIEFHESFVERAKELHKDVGLSVIATGLTEEAEMDGRYGPVLVGLLAADSVDVVTRAGAGGKLVGIIESDRGLAGREIERKDQSVTDVTKEDFDGLRTALIEAINGIPAALAESLKPETPVVEPKVEGDDPDDDKNEDKNEEPQVDAVEVAVKVAEAGLPASAIALVAAEMKKGVKLEEAVKAQTDYRDALLSTGEAGTVTRITENASTPRGLSYAVAKLNG